MNVGITGHQHFANEQAENWVANALRDSIVRLRPAEGFTSLAAGADQMFASALIDLGIPFTFVRPCLDYRSTFSTERGVRAFERLVAHARSTIELPFVGPSEDAFFAAGKKIVDVVDLVVAVWDGKPARGRGGTADVVAYARKHPREVLLVNPNTRSVTGVACGYDPSQP